MNRSPLLLMAAAILLAACAAPATQRIKVDDAAAEREAKLQSELALEGLLNDQFRLFRIGHMLRTKGHALCGDRTRYALGAYFGGKYAIDKVLRDAAVSRYGLGELPKVLYLVPGASVEPADLKTGDELIAIDGWPVPTGEDSPKKVVERFDETLKTGTDVALEVNRSEQRLTVTVKPEKACAFNVLMMNLDDLNAFADGKNVMVTRGMMRFAQNDTELALVVAHELAHNAMKHMDAKMQNYMLGSILDILIAARTGANTQGLFGKAAAGAYSQEFEAEADYAGLYIMAHAGMDIENAPQFWRRMAAAHPSSIRANYASSHPATSHRMLALEETVKEIQKKRAAGVPLDLEMKNKTMVAAAAPTSEEAGTSSVPAKASADLLEARLIGKEDKKVLLVTGLTLRLGFQNKGDKAIARFQGLAKLADEGGTDLGSVRIRHEGAVKPGETAQVYENLYPLVFSGNLDKLRELPSEKIRIRFEPELIEFSDGSHPRDQ